MLRAIPAMFSSLLEPTPSVILITILVVLFVPILLHLLLFRSPTRTALPTFLLLGPSGAGKTSLLTLVSIPHPPSSPFFPLIRLFSEHDRRTFAY